MNPEKTFRCSTETLYQELAGFRLTRSPLALDFSLDRLFADVSGCQIIKAGDRRQVFQLQTPTRDYFLKRSTLLRRKDRWRHRLLPFRKWAEWRNLQRLAMAGIPAAKPVLRGENVAARPKIFFLLTEKVDGLPLQGNALDEAGRIGAYAAKLHSHGIIHADLHPNNIIITPAGQFCLIDVQEVYFLPWLPRWLRVRNLAKIYLNLGPPHGSTKVTAEFLCAYNQALSDRVDVDELRNAAGRHQRRKYRSRSKRCCMNSTEFEVVKQSGLRGYQRRNFDWGLPELEQALEAGRTLKGDHVICHQAVCIKKHPKRFLHRDRCKASWKMSRCLEVRGIATPRSLSYLVFKGNAYFLSEFLSESQPLNAYLFRIRDPRQKRRVLKELALWLKKIHDTEVWQRDFKSSNILCQNGQFYMVDLDGVRIHRLRPQDRIVNLAQLNASVSNAITIKDRLRFYHFYSTGRRPSREQRREVYSRVWAITKTKNTAAYDLDIDKLWC